MNPAVLRFTGTSPWSRQIGPNGTDTWVRDPKQPGVGWASWSNPALKPALTGLDQLGERVAVDSSVVESTGERAVDEGIEIALRSKREYGHAVGIIDREGARIIKLDTTVDHGLPYSLRDGQGKFTPAEGNIVLDGRSKVYRNGQLVPLEEMKIASSQTDNPNQDLVISRMKQVAHPIAVPGSDLIIFARKHEIHAIPDGSELTYIPHFTNLQGGYVFRRQGFTFELLRHDPAPTDPTVESGQNYQQSTRVPLPD